MMLSRFDLRLKQIFRPVTVAILLSSIPLMSIIAVTVFDFETLLLALSSVATVLAICTFLF